MTTRSSFWIVLLLAAVCLGAAFVTTSDESALFMRLAFLWFFLLLSCWIITALSLRHITIKRELRAHRQQVGQILKEQISVHNRSWVFHIWVEVFDEGDLKVSGASRILTGLRRNQNRTYQSYTRLTQRGWFTLGPMTLISGDLFGLFQKAVRFAVTDKLLVIPAVIPLSNFPLPKGLMQGGKRLKTSTNDITPNAAGIREYLPGDPLTRIHWPSTVRRDRLMVKEFDQDPQTEVWIFLDAQKSVQAELPEENKSESEGMAWMFSREKEVKLLSATIEYSVCAAASIASYLIRKEQAVGLACAGQIDILLSAEKTDRQIGKILENLALIQGEGKIPLEVLVTTQAGRLSKGSVILLITPSTHKNIATMAGELVLKGMFPLVILIRADTFGSPESAQPLIERLNARGIPIIEISNQDRLQDILSAGAKWDSFTANAQPG